MLIKFIKEHPIGIKEGQQREVDSKFAKRMIDGGYAEIVSGDQATDTTSVVEEKPVVVEPVKDPVLFEESTEAPFDLEALKALYESNKASLNEDEQLQAEIDLESTDIEVLTNLQNKLNLLNTQL